MKSDAAANVGGVFDAPWDFVCCPDAFPESSFRFFSCVKFNRLSSQLVALQRFFGQGNVTKLLNIFKIFIKYLHNSKFRLIFALEVLRFI